MSLRRFGRQHPWTGRYRQKETCVAALSAAAELAAKNPIRRPNESDAYRHARQELLVEEIELRRHAERVASLRRQLPPGGEIPQDYRLVAEDGVEVTLSDLFGGHDTLIIYSYMFGPQRESPCPMCTSLMGALDHKITDIRQRVAIAFIARSPIERLIDAKKARGWTDLPVYSDASGDYTRHYVSPDDADIPAYNVFTRRDGVIRHFWGDEITGDMADPGQDPRGPVDLDPLWHLLDTSPEGRGTDWYPQLTY
jgi:predicted dithiol-disulfide oxidoreductase (DUF899 family)